uniref:Cytochrome b n=1 Tax=Symphylella sp. YG-2006 TaxID=390856 RepID=B7S773_9MYRI|nr:cytochrome b [Symphylella sp. YG-2006]ABQ01742.1 cytochrome b [Symphylella sp. YG-2006]
MTMLKKALPYTDIPQSISYMWNFGSLLGACLMTQILTGLFLAMNYNSSPELAFQSTIDLMNDSIWGYYLRIIHANGASLMFLCMYFHIGRGMYSKSYLNYPAWNIGLVMYLVTMATAFLGYVLPWGQMSFWGASVITNLMSAIPYAGDTLVKWLWGGYSVDAPTLSRFFGLHFILPLTLIFMTVLHIVLIHEKGANNTLGLATSPLTKTTFHPFFTFKDIPPIIIALYTLILMSSFKPYLFMDPDNFSEANPMTTPAHIQPEWYFLFAYAILRSIPNKLGGVIAMLLSIMILLTMPHLYKPKMSSNKFYPLNKMLFWYFIITFLLLTWGGAQLVEQPMILTSQVTSVLYFLFFILNPLYHYTWDKIMS